MGPLAFPPPPFDLRSLRRIGDAAACPVGRAVRAGALKTVAPPVFDADVLRIVGRRRLDAVARAVRENVLRHHGPCWSNARPAFDRVFATDLPHHLFRAFPHEWARFSEAQMTKGIAYFVNEALGATRAARARALLAGLGISAPEEMRGLTIQAEAPADRRRRIDLLIEWEEPQGRRTLAVEAKFEHAVTRQQLLMYKRWLGRRNGGLERVSLVLLTTPGTKNIGGARGMTSWRQIEWRSFLLAHERALPTERDDEDYQRFRRTLWARAA